LSLRASRRKRAAAANLASGATPSAGKRLAAATIGQLTELAGSPNLPRAEAFSRAVERFAEQHVSGPASRK